MICTIQQFDIDLFLKIHRGLSSGFLDWLLPLVRNRFFWAPLYLFIIIFCVKEYKRKGWVIIGMLLLTFAIGDMFSSQFIKPFVMRVRPCNEFTLHDLIIHRVPCGSGYSFPSIHATNHFAIAVFLILLFYQRWKPILPLGILWASMIAFAQVYVGVHYPIDTIAGALLGTTIGCFTYFLYKKTEVFI